jgi:adenosylcobinamide-GDP ribazoletransferase
MKHSVSGFRMAWGMFCSIPLGRPAWDESNRRSMLLALPLVGLIIGAMLGLGWLLLTLLPLPPLLCAACMTSLPILLTGGIHADGFMDVNDAVLSRREQSERLRILKDPHSGSFAILSIVLCLLLNLAAMDALFTRPAPTVPAMLMLLPCQSRACSICAVFSAQPLATSQYSRDHWTKDGRGAAAMILLIAGCIAAGFAAAAMLRALPLACCLPLACLGSFLSFRSAAGSLGGMSGDISGHMILTGELTGTLSLAVLTTCLAVW